MKDNKKKLNKNSKILFIILGAGIASTFLVIFDLITLETAIGLFAGTTIGAVIARIIGH